MQHIKYIIFDLGGVIMNISFHKTADAFRKLGVTDFDKYFTQTHAHPLFKQLETGNTSPEEFYNIFRTTTGLKVTDKEIETAWNAMLLDFPKDRIALLQELKKKYKGLFLFSNTNAIHHDGFQEIFRNNYGFEFDTLFDKAIYSHIAQYRKPDISAFENVLKQCGIPASETIFIDDTLPNIESARKAGIASIHLHPEIDLTKIFNQDLSVKEIV